MRNVREKNSRSREVGAGGALRRMSNSAKFIQSIKAIYRVIIGEAIHLCLVKQP